MSVGSVGSVPTHQHHKHVHKAGTPVTVKDPASGNNVAGAATTASDKALMANKLGAATASQSAPPPKPAPSADPDIGSTVDESV
jgi:hypothetical protein